MTELNLEDSMGAFHPCHCVDEAEDVEKTFCFAQGPQQDTVFADNKLEMTENTWYKIKPPRLQTKQFSPLVTARQIYVTRILLEGKRNVIEEEGGSSKNKDKNNISINKKKSAVRFLTKVQVDD